jgi:uncharacterized protein YqeY
VLRLLSTAIRNAEVEKRRELSDEEALAIVSKEVRRRQEAAEEYAKAGRPDRAAAEESEAAILRELLPEPLAPEEVDRLVEETIAEVGAGGSGDMGKVMAALMPKLKGRADAKRVSEMVRSRLQQ